MSRKVISATGRYHVIEYTRLDGAKVYDVEFAIDHRKHIRIHCVSQSAAELVSLSLATNAMDVSLMKRVTA